MPKTDSPDPMVEGIEEIGGSFALGQWLANHDPSFKDDWTAWCSDIRGKQGVPGDSSIVLAAVVEHDGGKQDRKLVFNYTGPQAVGPLRISVEDSDLPAQIYASLTDTSVPDPLPTRKDQANEWPTEGPTIEVSRTGLPETQSGSPLTPLNITTSCDVILMPKSFAAPASIPQTTASISTLPSSRGAKPESVALPEPVSPAVVGLPASPTVGGVSIVTKSDTAVTTPSFPRPKEAAIVTQPASVSLIGAVVVPRPSKPVTALPPAGALQPSVATLPETSRPVFASLPQTVRAAEDPATSLPEAGAAEFITAGQFLLPIKPFPSGESSGQTLAQAMQSLSVELPQAASDVLGHLQVRELFLVVKPDFKGLVLEVELDEPTTSLVRLSLARAGDKWVFGGEVIIPRPDKEGTPQTPHVFTLRFSSDKSSKTLVMAFDGELNLVDDLLRPMFGDRVSIPDGLSLEIANPVFALQKESAATDGQSSTKVLLGVNVSRRSPVDLGNLPFVGDAIKAQGAATIGLGIQYASAPFSLDQIGEINNALSSDLQFTTPDDAPFNGLHLSAAVQMTGEPLRLSIPLSGDGDGEKRQPTSTTAAGKQTQAAPSASTADPAIHWINVNRSVGPAYMEKVGVGFSNGAVQLRVSASVQMSGLSFFCEGLGVGLTLEWPPHPTFNLDGLGIGMDVPPVSISGALVRSIVDGVESYDGMALIKAANFTITGLGSYSTIGGDPSLFLFAILHKDLGGPAFFHVTGLAAGFGFNRALKLPSIEGVQDFPLVRGALDENYFSGSDASSSARGGIQAAMEKLRDDIPPSLGEYWFAVGVRFNSFEMIESFALLSISFGHEVVIALLGLSRMSLPKGAEPGSAIAYAELALRAVINIDEGSIAVEGRLTDNSYIFSKDCRLTGGFAFYSWFSGPHSGDFVITLGGYHPKFLRPEHYPVVPRLGVNWQVSSRIKVTAEFYFALTPSCLMAGGKMSAVYDAGAITAWYVAYADFLLSWQPFHYTIDMGITIGVSADLGLFSISVHISVDLHIWGPEFAGEIDVDLSVVSFSIRFGPDKTAPPPLTAKEFQAAFLPPAKPTASPMKASGGRVMLRAAAVALQRDVLAAQINSGLLRQETGPNNETLRVVNGHALALSVQSLIPVTSFGGIAPSNGNASISSVDLLGVRPMGKTKLDAVFSVTVLNIREPKNHPAERHNLRVTTIENGVPEAIWGRSHTEGVVPAAAPEANTINATLGIRIAFAPIPPIGALPAIDIEKFNYETFNKPIPWAVNLAPPEDFSSGETEGEDLHTAMSSKTKGKRDAVLKILVAQSPFLNEVDLTRLAKNPESYFQADPIICRLGSRNESIA